MLATRTIGRIVNRVCPRCGGELAAGRPWSDAEGDYVEGLVCVNPDCYDDEDEPVYDDSTGRWCGGHWEPLPEDLRLRLAGAKQLPGLD